MNTDDDRGVRIVTPLPPVPYELEIAELRKALTEARIRDEVAQALVCTLAEENARLKRQRATLTRALEARY